MEMFSNHYNLLKIFLLCCFCIVFAFQPYTSFAQTDEDIAGFMSDGQKCYRKGNLADAQIEFENVLLIDKNNFEAKIWLAQVLADRKKLKEAKKLILEAAKQAPDHPKVVQLMKLIGAKKVEEPKKDPVLTQTMALLERKAPARKYGIVIPSKKIVSENSANSLIDFDKRGLNEPEKKLDISGLEAKKGPLSEVFAAWENVGVAKALDIYFALLINNTKLLEISDKGLLAKGEEMFSNRLKLKPKDKEAAYYLGVIYYFNGLFGKSEKVLKILKDDTSKHENILPTVFSKLAQWRKDEDARILAEKKAEEERIAMEQELEAKKQAENAEKASKKDAWSVSGENDKNLKSGNAKISKTAIEAGMLHKKGFELYKKGRLDEAIAKYNKAIEKKNDDPEFYYHLGLAWTDKGLAGDSDAFTKAKNAFQQAVSLAPDSKLAEDSKSMINDIKSAEKTLGN